MMSARFKSQIDEVFAYWQKVMDHPSAKLLPVRQRAVAGRLKEGYSVAEIKLAIDGCRASDFHMGDNIHRTVYDDLTLICRDGAKLEQFIGKRRPLPKYGFGGDENGGPGADQHLKSVTACSACHGTGYIDSHPDTPVFVPGRSFLPCSACSPRDP